VRLLLPLVAALLLGGCGDKDVVPGHSAEEEKALKEAASLTPEQQIERIRTGGMPESAKEAMIADIKKKNGLK
jgi:hypothetical protein